MYLRSGKNKLDMRRRFFHSFQQGVECAGGKHMHLVYDIYLIFTSFRSIDNAFTQFSDIVYFRI